MIFNMVGGGGGGLNFRVLGGTAAPSSPKESDIWVNTDTEVRGWLFGADDPDLLDLTTWANEIGVLNGTRSVSGNFYTLTANASGDCYTDFTSLSKANIPCTPGKTYIMQWDHSGAYGDVYVFPGADLAGLVMTSAASGKLEYTAGEGVTFFTFRIGVRDANTSATYSNIRITEKDRAFSPGSVWITTGASSSVPFNALKKNSIMVYPLSASQYIDGAWVKKSASMYKNGGWTVFSVVELYLYNTGDACTADSGGWSLTSNTGQQAMALSKGSSYMTVSSSWSGNYTSHSTCGTGGKVNVTSFSKLNIVYDFSASVTTRAGAGDAYANLTFGLGTSDTSVSSASVKGSTGTNKTVSLDISSLKTSLYVVAQLKTYGQNGNINLKIRKVWLS